MYGVGSLFLCWVNDVGVYLGGLDIGMSKHRLNCIDVRAKFQLERCIRMSGKMEGYMFLDASSLYPFLQWLRNPGSVLQPCKYKKLLVFGTSTTHGIRLVGNGKICTHLCLYLWDVYAPTAVACLWYLLPLQVLDIYMTQTSQDREERSASK